MTGRRLPGPVIVEHYYYTGVRTRRRDHILGDNVQRLYRFSP